MTIGQNSSPFRELSLIFDEFPSVNEAVTSKLSWWNCSGFETIRLGRTQPVGSASVLLNNFPIGFTHGSTHPRIADLGCLSGSGTHFLEGLEVEHRLAKNKI